MSEENKAIARRFAEVLNTGRLADFDELAAPNFVGYLPAAPALDREGWKQFSTAFITGFPDRRVTIEQELAEGDLVAWRGTFRGSHAGDFQGIPPTGKQVSFTGMAMFRIANGKIVEHWGEFDGMGLMQQLGVIPAPAQARG